MIQKSLWIVYDCVWRHLLRPCVIQFSSQNGWTDDLGYYLRNQRQGSRRLLSSGCRGVSKGDGSRCECGSFLVDIFPLLRFISDWFPGAGFKRKAKEWRKSIVAMPAVTMDFVEQSIVGFVFLSASEIVDPRQKNGSAKPSIAYKYLSQMDADEARTKEAEEILSGTMASFYAGGCLYFLPGC